MENDDINDGNITIGVSSLGTSLSSWNTINSSPGSLYIGNGGTGASTYNYTTMAPNYSAGIVCEGDANFNGDVKVKGKSIVDSLEAIEKRLSILTPDPKKLAKYEALQKAYAHYKTIEAMCHDDD